MRRTKRYPAKPYQLAAIVRTVYEAHQNLTSSADLKDAIKWEVLRQGYETPHPELLAATMNQVEAALAKAGTLPLFLRPPLRRVVPPPPIIESPRAGLPPTLAPLKSRLDQWALTRSMPELAHVPGATFNHETGEVTKPPLEVFRSRRTPPPSLPTSAPSSSGRNSPPTGRTRPDGERDE